MGNTSALGVQNEWRGMEKGECREEEVVVTSGVKTKETNSDIEVEHEYA